MDKQKRHQLRSRAHALKPTILTGQAGITGALLVEIDRALEHHALLKVRINAETREERQAMLAQICAAVKAESIQVVGRVATLFREGPRHMA